ncbi:ATP-binding cassette domain-containing protein [Nocardioides dongxiaopingii]|uniref:ABC transporter ATP-binding protein n=1 Tax=Nocardioides TaxID=1839 RepID=UPI0010C770B1|nr:MULTISPECIES: ATP-binding cassette domain-containing protein [Nocardioides]QCW49563.1 ATP-binding cassette domain-containing protein [Nocardioides sp. S-1144]
MLSARDVWFRYHRRGPWVLSGAGIEVAPGEVVGLRGPSGCGKTTLGAVLGGLVRPGRGSVEVAGVPVAAGRGARPVQVVLQHPERAMNPRWRVRDVLAEAGPAPAPEDAGLVDPGWLDRFPHEISGGELQRVNLARALRTRPAFLVADEISSSLDALTQALLWRRVLDEVAERATGVVVVSHDQPLLDRVADRVVELDRAAPAG